MLSYFVVVPVLVGVFLYVASTNSIARIGAIVFQAALFAASIYLVMLTRGDDVVVTYIGNFDGVLGIALRANALSADFVLITAFIFLAVSVYSFKEKRDTPLYWFLLFVMEASLLGLFLSGDMFNIFVLVEVSTVVTLVLCLYDRAKRDMFAGMLFLMVNIVAAQFYLLGIGIVYMQTGTLDMNAAAAALVSLDRQSLALPYALIMTSIAFKCSLIPFFSWTPKVRIYPFAPTVVQAILSGLQIKTAVYLLLSFQDLFAGIAAVDFFLVLGIVSGLFGAFMAICQTDIRMILAYHTISQVGLIVIGISIGYMHSDLYMYSYVGGLYHIFSHAAFKTTLFLASGAIVHVFGTSNVYQIRGVLRKMPVVGAAAAAAVLGITGAPLFIGSVSKYFISYDVPLVINIAVIVISLGTIISFIKFSSILFGKADGERVKVASHLQKMLPLVVLGAVCLAGGIFGPQIIYFLFNHNVSIVLVSYVQKSLIFAASVVVGYFIYTYLIKGRVMLKRIGAMHLGFRSVCASIAVFFGLLLVYVAFLA